MLILSQKAGGNQKAIVREPQGGLSSAVPYEDFKDSDLHDNSSEMSLKEFKQGSDFS